MSAIPTTGFSVANGISSTEQTAFETAEANRSSSRLIGGDARLSTLDAAKGLAACLIVAHHLAFYGRPADILMNVAPGIIRFLFDDARMIVQLFMVVSGFVLAWTQADGLVSWQAAWQAVARRYLRLLVPYACMLVILVMAASLLGDIGVGNALVESISVGQFIAHLLFLQGLLGYENLSAGAWYLCIDMQFAVLFFTLAALVSDYHACRNLTSSSVRNVALVLAGLGSISAWYWNRIPAWDNNVFYFLAPFVLGCLVAWQRRGTIRSWELCIYAVLLAAACLIDFRPRLIIALLCGIAVWMVAQFGSQWRMPRPLVWLGKVSYSLFLIHYVVACSLMVLLDTWMGSSPLRAGCLLLVCFGLSLLAAAWLHYSVEKPLLRWLRSSRTSPARRQWLNMQRQAFEVPLAGVASIPLRSDPAPTTAQFAPPAPARSTVLHQA